MKWSPFVAYLQLAADKMSYQEWIRMMWDKFLELNNVVFPGVKISKGIVEQTRPEWLVTVKAKYLNEFNSWIKNMA